jgi:hypothetical protein
MNDSLVSPPSPTISPAVEEFAAIKGFCRYLSPVIDLARQAFPSSALAVSVGQDAEDERHEYIALDVEVGNLAVEELLVGQRTWSAGLSGVCPSCFAICFVLGWR